MLRERQISAVLVLIASVLLAIWPLPDTIALRNLLLAVGGVVSVYFIWKFGSARVLVLSRGLWPLMAIFLWVLLHFFLFSINVAEQSAELNGDWIRTFLATILGITVGHICFRNNEGASFRNYQLILMVGFFGTSFFYLVRYFVEVFAAGHLLFRFDELPYHGKISLVVFCGFSLLYSIFVLLDRLMSGGRSAAITFFTGFFCICAFTVFFFANTKNGFLVGALILLLAFRYAVFSVTRPGFWSWRSILSLSVIAAFMAIALGQHIGRNMLAWSDFLINAEVASDIEGVKYWRDPAAYGLPTNSAGRGVDASTYERAAWAIASYELMKENPSGYGLINHSFGAMAKERWPDFRKPDGKNRGSSHSGLIDFSLAFGIPGIVLLLMTFLFCFLDALKTRGFWALWVRNSVPILFVMYLMAEVCTGHFIEFLFFLLALFAVIGSNAEVGE